MSILLWRLLEWDERHYITHIQGRIQGLLFGGVGSEFSNWFGLGFSPIVSLRGRWSICAPGGP